MEVLYQLSYPGTVLSLAFRTFPTRCKVAPDSQNLPRSAPVGLAEIAHASCTG